VKKMMKYEKNALPTRFGASGGVDRPTVHTDIQALAPFRAVIETPVCRQAASTLNIIHL